MRAADILRDERTVRDAWAVEHRSANDSVSTTVYVVPDSGFTSAAVLDRLRAAGVAARLAVVSHLPLSVEGAIDEEALARAQRLPEAAAVGMVPRMPRGALALDRRPQALPAGDRPAIAAGPPLDADGSRTLGDLLERAAGGGRVIQYVARDGEETEQRYDDLLEAAARFGAGLAARGLGAGDRALLVLDDRRDFLTGFWGCVWAGVVAAPCPTAPSYSEDGSAGLKLESAWRTLGGAPVIAPDALRPALEGFARRRGLAGFSVLPIEELASAAASGARHPPSPTDDALLLLTSGSSGRSRMVRLSHRALVAQAAATVQMNGFVADDVSLNWFPLDHVGGLVMFHLRDVSLGCRQIQASMERVLEDPLRWLEWIDRFRVTITWAPNFAFALIGDREREIERRRWDVSSLRFILNGGEPIVARQARRFLALLAPHGLPPTAMHPAWGMSETCSAVTFNHEFRLDATSDDDGFVSVGRPIPGMAIRIVDADGGIANEGVVGRLEVRGPCTTAGYVGEATPVVSGDGWFDTGDLAFMAGGRLTITGRVKDVVIVNGLNLACQEIEAIAAEADGVEPAGVAAVAIRGDGAATDELAMFVVARPDRDPAQVAEAVRLRVLEKIGIRARVVVPLPALPRTSIGKIERAELRRSLECGALADRLSRVSRPDWFQRRIWQRREGGAARPPGRWLVLGQGLAPSGDRVLVEPGRQFERVSANHYRIRPAAPDDYACLLGEIGELEGVAYLAGTDEGRSVDSLVALVRALSSRPRRPARICLVLVTRLAQAVPGDGGGDPAQATLIGLARAFGNELPWLRVRLVDVDDTPVALGPELTVAGADDEVAFRGGRRLVTRLARAELASDAWAPAGSPLYLVTGGLGALGSAVACWLAERGARLLVVGRQPLGARLEQYQLLERIGAVRYEVADVADESALRAAVDVAERRFDARLDGVFHLAGELAAGPAMDLSQAQLDRALRAKANAMAVLDRLVTARQGRLFVSIASLAGYYGGAGVAAYAAANAFQLAFCASQRRRASFACYSVVLGMCGTAGQGVGMSAGHSTELAAARGYVIVSPQELTRSLSRVLASPPGEYMIGLDPHAPEMRWRGSGPVALLDESSPASHDSPVGGQSAREREREVSQRLAQLWRELLELDRVAPDENFFDLGGNSLVVPRLCGRLEATFGRRIAPIEIFRYPTIRAFTAFLVNTPETSSGPEAVRPDRSSPSTRRGDGDRS